ncbi:MAG: O-antigen ligase family protein [Clostridia bacterium]|nr:O-antigen ligase family protein [Clostridia bacterium]
MKKHLYLLIAVMGLILGVIGAFMTIKVSLVLAAGALVFAALLLDYQKATYLVALYLVLDNVLRRFADGTILSSNWDELLFVFTVMLWMYKWFVHRKQDAYRWTPLEVPLVFFMGIATFLMIINSPDISIGIEGLRVVIEYVLWYFIIVQLLKTPAGARRMLYILVFIGTGLALHGVFQYLTGAEMPANWVDQMEQGVRTRAFSIVGSPNILGSLMVLLIPLSISFIYSEEKKFKKGLFALIALTMIACLVVTLSRGAWIGFAVAILIFFLMKDKRLIVPIILLMVLVLVFVPSVASRITYMLSPEYIASSLKGGRLVRWGIGLQMLLENLWFGVGLGRFGGAVAMNNKNLFPNTFYMDNYFLKTAVEMGLIGLTAFFLLIYNVVIWSLRTIRNLHNTLHKSLAQGAFAGMCGVIVHNFFENVFEVPMMVTYFWVLAAAIMFLGYVNTRNTRKGSEAC